VAPLPSVPPSPDPTLLHARYLNTAQCHALFADENSRFHQLWDEEGWVVRPKGKPACWGDDPRTFFSSARNGTTCDRNWFEGNPGKFGYARNRPNHPKVWPHFTLAAPALLGFDENIDGWCHSGGGFDHGASCVRNNLNILSLYFPAQYNLCRNFEWQMCAALGYLPGQGGKLIRFAFSPGELELRGGPHPLGSCTGYHPSGCDDQGYASSDIFFLEACVYATICENGDEIFGLAEGQDWHCELSKPGFARLSEWLAGPLALAAPLV